MILIKGILIALFLVIFYQDARDRLVHWFLFPAVAIIIGILHYNAVTSREFVITVLINGGLVVFMLLILLTYAKGRGYGKLQEVFGLGDICMLLALSLGSATITFVVLLVFGLVFSLGLHTVLRVRALSRKQTSEIHNYTDNNVVMAESIHNTIPLAGYLAVFFSAVFIAQWSGLYSSIYIL